LRQEEYDEMKQNFADDFHKILCDTILDGVFLVSPDGFEYVNRAFERITGFSLQEMRQLKLGYLDFIHPEDRALIIQRREARAKELDIPPLFEIRFFTKSGELRYGEVNSAMLPGQPGSALAIIRDITERKRSESSLHESEEKCRSVIERAKDGISIIQDAKFVFVNPAMAEMLGYSVEELLATPVTNILSTDNVELLVDRYNRRMAGEDVIPSYPIKLKKKNGEKIIVEINACIISYMGMPAHLAVLHDMTEHEKNETELRTTLAYIRQAMGATVQALNKTVEMRDPYTAGHQRRVADLSRAIVKEMDLPKEKIEAIRMAAAVHDLGKIAVPAEILSRPGRLNDSEFSLIKAHPRIGFDILKTIKFPWPIADIVLQHHERLNGSGYPQGLKDKEISIEAKIIGVADVVEAMLSHRPYRRAHPLELALKEINENKGILYEPDVTAICMNLFTTKNYTFRDKLANH
jgi:PAS domain S-box-containing protein